MVSISELQNYFRIRTLFINWVVENHGESLKNKLDLWYYLNHGECVGIMQTLKRKRKFRDFDMFRTRYEHKLGGIDERHEFYPIIREYGRCLRQELNISKKKKNR